jgi:hypothetical protein
MMDDIEKTKAPPRRPGVRQGWIVLALMVFGSVLGVHFGNFPPYGILFVPPFSTVTLYLALLTPFIWIPFYLVWRKSLAETAWLKIIPAAAMLTFCAACSLSYDYIRTYAVSFDCKPTTPVIVVCQYRHNTLKAESLWVYKRIENTPFMQEYISPAWTK